MHILVFQQGKHWKSFPSEHKPSHFPKSITKGCLQYCKRAARPGQSPSTEPVSQHEVLLKTAKKRQTSRLFYNQLRLFYNQLRCTNETGVSPYRAVTNCTLVIFKNKSNQITFLNLKGWSKLALMTSDAQVNNSHFTARYAFNITP